MGTEARSGGARAEGIHVGYAPTLKRLGAAADMLHRVRYKPLTRG